MDNIVKAAIGDWYKRLDLNALFEVVALDREDSTIEIQYIDGEIEELDDASWEQLPIETAAAPEDWSAGYEVDKADLIDEYQQTPHNLGEALNELEKFE